MSRTGFQSYFEYKIMLAASHIYGMFLKAKESYHHQLWRGHADSFSTVLSDYPTINMPNQKQNIAVVIRDITVIVIFLFGGAYFIYIAAHGLLTNQAVTIGKDSPWLTRRDNPEFFWFSIIFHAMAGLFSVLNGIRMLTRILATDSKDK